MNVNDYLIWRGDIPFSKNYPFNEVDGLILARASYLPFDKISFKEGDTFECELLGNNFTIKIEDISDKKIKLSSSKYGLFPIRENGSISLIDKVKNFELSKGENWF